MRFKLNDNSDQASALTKLVKTSDEIYIATTFLTVGGLDTVLAELKNAIRREVSIQIIVGLDSYKTEPDALYELFFAFRYNKKCKLHLACAQKADSVFNPNLFLFRRSEESIILSTSAGLSYEGLTSSVEYTSTFCGHILDCVWSESLDIFDKWLTDEFSVEANILMIEEYENSYQKQRQFGPARDQKLNIRSIDYNFDFERFKGWFQAFNNIDREKEYLHKTFNYSEANYILDQIAYSDLDRRKFSELFDKLILPQSKNRYWGSKMLQPNRGLTAFCFDKVQSLIAYIHDNIRKSPEFLFEHAKDQASEIHGFDIEYVTEILITFDTERFARLSDAPLNIIQKTSSVILKKTPEDFDGDDYKTYCDIVKRICNALSLHDMLEVDSFFDFISKQYQKAIG